MLMFMNFMFIHWKLLYLNLHRFLHFRIYSKGFLHIEIHIFILGIAETMSSSMRKFGDNTKNLTFGLMPEVASLIHINRSSQFVYKITNFNV